MAIKTPIIIIVGLRRSGTTAFWESFRKNSKLCCYDEPFNPNLSEIPYENAKGTRKEFIKLYNLDPEDFRKYFSAIPTLKETDRDLTKGQQNYLRWLISKSQESDGIVIESVRLNFKLKPLYPILTDSILVHLYRNPISWISSHMIPSGKGTWRKFMADIYRKISFWNRQGFYNNWKYQEIIENEISNNSYWDILDFNSSRLKNEPAIVKLAYFWNWAFKEVEQEGCRIWGDRFFSVPFERFCEEPSSVLSKIYDFAGLKNPSINYSFIRTANRGFKPECSNWNCVTRIVSNP